MVSHWFNEPITRNLGGVESFLLPFPCFIDILGLGIRFDFDFVLVDLLIVLVLPGRSAKMNELFC